MLYIAAWMQADHRSQIQLSSITFIFSKFKSSKPIYSYSSTNLKSWCIIMLYWLLKCGTAHRWQTPASEGSKTDNLLLETNQFHMKLLTPTQVAYHLHSFAHSLKILKKKFCWQLEHVGRLYIHKQAPYIYIAKFKINVEVQPTHSSKWLNIF